MATIVTRAGKGTPLTNAEVDANFTNLNDDKLETAGGVVTGNLGVGGDTTGVVDGITVTSKFCVKSSGPFPVGGFVFANNTSAGTGSGVFYCRSRGTLASPSIVQNNDRLATLFFAGHDGVDLALAAQIEIEVDGVPGSNDMPTRMIFKTTPAGQQTPVEAIRIGANQVVTLANALPIASGGTGITSFGAGVATWLGTPSSANLAAAVTDETGSGALVFANSPTLVTPALGTPSSGVLSGCTVDGTNKVGYRNVPAVGTKTSSYTLAVGDVGKYVQVGSGGSITIPSATFAEGDIVSIYNNTTGDVTITCSITTAYIAGVNEDKASVALATRGVATILFISSTLCVISGNVS
jgi:hypothetical protein